RYWSSMRVTGNLLHSMLAPNVCGHLLADGYFRCSCCWPAMLDRGRSVTANSRMARWESTPSRKEARRNANTYPTTLTVSIGPGGCGLRLDLLLAQPRNQPARGAQSSPTFR